jgi:nicotinic acid mononucleotide adenylyltransferase
MPEVTIDEVWVVPCGKRPDKPKLSNPKIRLEMTKLAV